MLSAARWSEEPHMAVFDLFSKRQKRLRGEMPDVYQYDTLPQQLRGQIVHIIRDAFGRDVEAVLTEQAYSFVYDLLCREYGVFQLTDHDRHGKAASLIDFFLTCPSVDESLDVVETCFRYVDVVVREDNYMVGHVSTISPDQAIEELNTRFQEHGIGYRFESGKIVRIDSQLIHANVVKPTLLLLQDRAFKGPNDEFLVAHEHYRHGRYKECINECLKAFESVLKVICSKRKWPYDPKTATAKQLIHACFTNNLIPSYLQSEFSSLRALLESGIPTTRSKTSAHGQGAAPIAVPQYLAGYALHLTATNILFLVEAEKATP
jgi:hypothetical protein